MRAIGADGEAGGSAIDRLPVAAIQAIQQAVRPLNAPPVGRSAALRLTCTGRVNQAGQLAGALSPFSPAVVAGEARSMRKSRWRLKVLFG